MVKLEIEILDYDNKTYTVSIAFNSGIGIYFSLDLSLSDLASLKEVVGNAIAEVKERIAKEAGNQAE